MRYGHFDDERREYVISRPDTPLPWINYLGTEEYFGIISNTAGGYSFLRDARLRRLTRYRSNNVPFDFGGRYLYVRDDTTGEYWSPSWQPTQTALDSYECRHGLSYTIISSTYSGIRAETLYYVPLGETLEIWRVRLANLYDDPRELSLFSSVEFCLWDAQDDASNFQRNFSTGEVEVADGVIFHKTEYRERRAHFAYFACSEPVAGFDTDREAFLGSYRGFDRPIAVERGYFKAEGIDVEMVYLDSAQPINQFPYWDQYNYTHHRRCDNALFVLRLEPYKLESGWIWKWLRHEQVGYRNIPIPLPVPLRVASEFESVTNLGVREIKLADGRVFHRVELFGCYHLK